ncbi:unnamed protein product [Pieris brassicae]|uniref:Uncharacterized protein n=1 Tax=Pieris brassicae TaxID=7116 RepID=A0A9P0XID1_PIEBR|nr:unnamed protein product [Pieris brassicae]
MEREVKRMQKCKILHNQQTSNVSGKEVSISSSSINTGRDNNRLPNDLVKSYLQTVCDRKRTGTFSSYNETSDFDFDVPSNKRRKGTSDSQKIVSGNGEQMVQIGMEKAIVPAKLLEDLAGSSYTIATRKLLSSVFSRQKRVAERSNPWYNGIYSHQIRRAAIDKHLKKKKQKSAILLQRSSRKASRQNVPMRARCNVAKIGIINGNPRKEIIQHFILITGAGHKSREA